MATWQSSPDGPVQVEPKPKDLDTIDYSVPASYDILVRPFSAVLVRRKHWATFMGLTLPPKNYEYQNHGAVLLASSRKPEFRTTADTKTQQCYLPKDPELEDFFIYQVSQMVFDIIKTILPSVRWFAFMARIGCEKEAHENPMVLTIHIELPVFDARIDGKVASSIVDSVLSEISRNNWQGEQIWVNVACNKYDESSILETDKSVDEHYTVMTTDGLGDSTADRSYGCYGHRDVRSEALEKRIMRWN
ncbi:hypothetical protein BJ875DRAFT_442663 [Amylocarpus encephaloides]|uniref:Uncharacterized protein n=1 Tax=Amylocarpus encephaloides TaxID=45428 RepID=A0A9P8C4B4_9HELO|nr:hypothetical protein BJ875DRAFT_442663 [Amylocarpus encephaloides]